MLTQIIRGASRAALAALLGLAAALPAGAAAQTAPIDVVDSELPFVSDNIALLGSIPVAGAIGAVFRGDYMYVTGVSGLSTYDISDPAAPQLTSVFPLPHFENEDVSLGGNILLIANDSAEGVGVLYVFDLSNPAVPLLRSAFPTGGDILLNDVPSHTATCIQGCNFAYLAGSARGIAIVDLRNPDLPAVAGFFTPPITDWATHDVEVDSQGYAWIVGADGTAAYDVRNPLQPVLVARTDAGATTGPLNDFIHHNAFRMTRTRGGREQATDIVLVTEEDYNRPTCADAGSFQTWKINGGLSALTPATLTNLDSWATELDELTRLEGKSPATILCSAHYFDVRDGLVAQGWYEQGTRILDVRDPANIKQVGYFVMPVTETWAAYWAPTDPQGEIIYSVDLARGIDILRIERPAPDRPGVRAPVRKRWLAEEGAPAPAPAAEFSSADPTFGWICRIVSP